MRARGQVVLGLAGLFLAAAAPAETPDIETITVTGSAIPSADLAAEHPITVITAAQLEQSNTLTLQQYLQKVPAIGFQGFTSGQSNGAIGNNFVDLRNLGPARTLVLVDGKRLPPSSNQISDAVDIGAIPVSMIERIEILRDGASPIYGSDAIGGVINVILKRDYDGVEASAQIGASTHADGTAYDFASVLGHGFERGNITLGVEHSSTDPIAQRSRSWSRDQFLPIEPNGSLTVLRNPDGIAIFSQNGKTLRELALGDGQFRPFTNADRFDLSTYSELTIGQERTSADLQARYDLAPDVSAYAQILFSDRKSALQKNPAVLGLTPVTEAFPTGFVVPASAPGNPFGQSVVLSKTFTQIGPQTGAVDAPSYRILADFRGALDGGWHWDVSYGYGRDSEQIRLDNQVNFKHAEQEVGEVPVTPADLAAGYVPGNFFGPNSLSPAAIDYLRYTSTARADFEQHTIDGTLSGALADLPAGPLEAAFGGAWRRLSGAYTPDVVTLEGEQAGADASPTAGGYTVREGFVELKAPLLADLPALKEFELNAATRYSNYSNFGDAVTWKVGLDWKLSDDLGFRAARSTGVRAPSISELYLGRTSISGALNDPCDPNAGILKAPHVAANCAAQGVPAGFQQPTNNYDVLLGGNPRLQPETAQTWSFGAVVTPRFLPGLAVTADYFDIFIRNAIGSLAATSIVQGCYTSVNLSSPLCALIGPRGPVLHNLTIITDLEANQGAIKTDGVDLTARYGFGLGAYGRVVIDDASTFTFSNLQQVGAGGKFVQLAGTVDQPTSATNPGAIPHFRSTGSLTWSEGPASFGWTTRFIGAVHALGTDLGQDGNHVHAVFYHDITGSWDLGRATLIAGIDNLFDKNPPFYDDGTVNTSEYTYDLIGRFFYVKAVARF